MLTILLFVVCIFGSAILALLHRIRLSLRLNRYIMAASLSDLTLSISVLSDAVDALVAQGSSAPEDLQPAVDAVDALTAKVNAALKPAAPPAQ